VGTVVDELGVVQDGRIGGEKIFQSVIVKVSNGVTPTGEIRSERGQTKGVSLVDKFSALIAEERKGVAQSAGNEDVGLSVVVDVAKVGAHSRDGLAVLVISHAQYNTRFRESAVLIVAEDQIAKRVIGYKDI